MADVAGLQLSNTAQRVLTGVVVAPLVLLAVVAGGVWFTLVTLLVSVVALIEFYMLASNRLSQGSTLVGVPALIAIVLALHFSEPLLLVAALVICALVTFALEIFRHHDVRRSLIQAGMTLVGVAYIGLPAGFLVSLRAIPGGEVINTGLMWIFLILCVTWGTDIFAYVGGRLWGKTPLAPQISPKKTREGAVVGVIGGIVPSLLLLAVTGNFGAATILFTLFGPFVAIIGDLFESALKRYFQVKDSHVAGLDLLPGHGGILDRIDALLLVSAFAYVMYNLFGR